MRKNKMMRAASGLLIATLLTTSVISGTFAKYVTDAKGSDSARVAKWGVTAKVNGSLFGADYQIEKDGTGNEIIAKEAADITASVSGRKTSGEAAVEDKVVAPGTQNSTGVTISVSGTPEVANKVTFSNTSSENKDVYLKAGTYGTMVAAQNVTADNFAEGTYYTHENSDKYEKANSYTAATNYFVLKDEVTLNNDYYPIIWNVEDNVANGSKQSCANISAVLEKLKDLSTTTNNDSLKAIDKSYTITWKWNIENGSNESDKNTNNGADTILGNLVANNAKAVVVKKDTNATDEYAIPGTNDYSTEVAFNYSIKVEQID